MTTQELLGLIRKEAAIAFDIRDAAAKVASTSDRLCKAVGGAGEEIRAATDAHDSARATLSAHYRRLVEHSEAMNRAAVRTSEVKP